MNLDAYIDSMAYEGDTLASLSQSDQVALAAAVIKEDRLEADIIDSEQWERLLRGLENDNPVTVFYTLRGLVMDVVKENIEDRLWHERKRQERANFGERRRG